MLIHSMDCDEGPGAHLICQQGEPKGTWEDSWKALESLKQRQVGLFSITSCDGMISFCIAVRVNVKIMNLNSFQNNFEPKEFKLKEVDCVSLQGKSEVLASVTSKLTT